MNAGIRSSGKEGQNNMMLVLFMEYRRKAVYTAKARIGFWGMFLVGVFLIVKAKSTGMSVGLMEEIIPQSKFFHPFSLLFYNPKLPPFSTPVAHHNYEAGDQPCGRHAHIVAAEANRGERQQEGEREADAQVDEAGSCRDLDIACTLQKTAGDVGDRAGPDEEHQDVEMFLCAPQGLSGDVEDLEKRPVKKQNYDTDGDTDQDAHQDGGAVAAAGTVQFFSADILSGEAGNGDVKALGRDVRELFDLQHGSVALDAGSAEGVDETLQDEEAD